MQTRLNSYPKSSWKRREPWTEQETEFLLKNYNTMPKDELARKLNRTKSAIYTQVHNIRVMPLELKKWPRLYERYVEKG